MSSKPQYKSPVSLIPNACMQFLDFTCDSQELSRIRRAFREELRSETNETGSQQATRQNTLLHCPVQSENGYVDISTGAPADYDYELTGAKSLEIWLDQWIPIPFFRLRDQKWPDGDARFDAGPSNWSRARITRSVDEPTNLHITLAFEMAVEEPSPSATDGQTFALSPDDVAAHAVFQLAHHARDNSWFLNSPWIDEWLFAMWTGKAKRAESEYQLEYLAQYLTLLEMLRKATADITVQVIDPKRDVPIDVDLILDLGNSRTTGILVETLPQRPTNLNDSYLLQLRDLSCPENIYTEPFATRVEFTEALFGNDSLSRRSGRSHPAFAWPSVVRIGPEATRLATKAVCAEGTTGLSSPKRYLWDERPWQQSWRYNTNGGPEPMVTRGLLPKRVNAEGTPLICFDDPLCTRHPILRLQAREVAFESHFTRSSLMMFLMVEVLLQALTTINSPAQRSRQELPNIPRRLRRIIFTVPSGMPIAEQRIYKRWLTWAVKTLWDCLGWQEFYQPPQKHIKHDMRTDFRTSPSVRCDWDEATCTQLVYLYDELTRKFQGDAHHLFTLIGSQREAYGKRPSIRMATIDIGGGTTDLAITTFELESEETDTARIRPHLNFRDGFNIAGDDIVLEIIQRHLLTAIGEAAQKHGIADPRNILAQLFGRNVMGTSQQTRNRRAQFTRQIAVPVALYLLRHYEQSDFHGGSGVSMHQLKDAFGVHDSPEPSAAVIQYVEEAIQNESANTEPFSLMDIDLRLDPHAMDSTIKDAMARVLANLCDVIRLYDCDLLLLTGRPSRWNGIITSVFAKLPVVPDRIIPMSQFRVGNWYPFADALGKITDPKTTVVVGAILCALAEGHLEGFSFDTSTLQLASTARFIGEIDITGQLKASKVWFEVDVNAKEDKEYTRSVTFSGPIAVGFRQLENEHWTTSRFYMVDFANEEARRQASGKLPYQLAMRLVVRGSEDDDTNDRDEGDLFIEEIQDKDGNTIKRQSVNVRLQTLQLDEGYWLDTGIITQTV